jgi:multiple sugar transport system ATP-binding protein
MADKIAVLRDGRVEQYGTPLELYNTPGNIFVAGFIGSPKMNFLKGTVQHGEVALETGEIVALPTSGFDIADGAAVTMGVRPNALQPGATGVRAKVTGVEILGGESYIYATSANDLAMTVHSPGQTDVILGADVTLSIATSDVHLFETATGRTLRSNA